jgi:hypothetical protein
MSDSRVLDVDPNQMSQEELAEIGRRAIYELNLREAGRKFRETREAHRAASAEAKAAALADDGRNNEVKLAELMGVDRMTIRAWLGKGRTTKKAAAE